MNCRRWLIVFAAALTFGCGDDTANPTSDHAVPLDLAVPADLAFVWPTGALVSATMNSQVAVLLDDLPASMRDRVAAKLMMKPDAFWIARAKAQVNLTKYRLSFRAQYYPGSSPKKMQLPLPPDTQWKISIASVPTRTVVNGHDVVAVSYSLASLIVTTADSPGITEPALATVGGSWDEPFNFPIDPELLIQRTGYACMDEFGFPPNSVDAEEAAVFYDQTCGVEPVRSNMGCHLTQLPGSSCLDALKASVGEVDTVVHFTRLAWDAAAAAPARVGAVTFQSGPDIAVGSKSAIFPKPKLVYRYIDANSCTLTEQCVGGKGWRRLLEFSSVNWNVGAKTLNIGPIDYYVSDAGSDLSSHHMYEYSACHMHYHFMHYGSFTYGPMGAGNSKRGFCLQSTDRLSNNEYAPLHNAYSDCTYQGIEAGWGDNYNAGIECQWIDVTGYDVSAGPVTQKLKETFNPDGFLCEGTPVVDSQGKQVWEPTSFRTAAGEPVDRPQCTFFPSWDANNASEEDITIPAAGQSYVTEACTRGQIGPARNCGFYKQDDRKACTAGQLVHLSCSLPSGATPHAVRVCESSARLGSGIACTFADALSNVLVSPTGATSVDFTCPGARDSQEPGGAYSVYSSTLVDEDTPRTVTCL